MHCFPYTSHIAVFIPWEGLRQALSERISAAIGRRVSVKIDIEEADWWGSSVMNTKITPDEMERLFSAFNADEEIIEEHTVLPEAGVPYQPNTASLSNEFTLKIVRDILPVASIAQMVSIKEGLWLIDGTVIQR